MLAKEALIVNAKLTQAIADACAVPPSRLA